MISLESNPTLPPTASSSSVPLPQDLQLQGRFIGAVRIRSIDYFADALVAQDGRVRLHIGGPSTKTGLLQVMKAQRTMQFVGTIDLRGGGLYGSGMIMNEPCVSSWDCAAPTPAELNIAQIKSEMRGELRMLDPVSSGESWSVDLVRWESADARPTISILAASAARA